MASGSRVPGLTSETGKLLRRTLLRGKARLSGHGRSRSIEPPTGKIIGGKTMPAVPHDFALDDFAHALVLLQRSGRGCLRSPAASPAFFSTAAGENGRHVASCRLCLRPFGSLRGSAMLRLACGVFVLGAACCPGPGLAASAEVIVEIRAGDHDRECCVASVELPPALRACRNLRLVRLADGQALPVQVDETAVPRACWCLREKLPAGTTERYRLEAADGPPTGHAGVSVADDGKRLWVKVGDKNVLAYNQAIVPAPIRRNRTTPRAAICIRSSRRPGNWSPMTSIRITRTNTGSCLPGGRRPSKAGRPTAGTRNRSWAGSSTCGW